MSSVIPKDPAGSLRTIDGLPFICLGMVDLDHIVGPAMMASAHRLDAVSWGVSSSEVAPGRFYAVAFDLASLEDVLPRYASEMCEYCNRDDVPLYGWYGDVWCAYCIAQDHRKPAIPVAQARLGRPDWFSDRARRDEAYATPYLIPSPLVHSTALVLKGVDTMP